MWIKGVWERNSNKLKDDSWHIERNYWVHSITDENKLRPWHITKDLQHWDYKAVFFFPASGVGEGGEITQGFGFLKITLKVTKQWNNAFKILKENYFQPKFLSYQSSMRVESTHFHINKVLQNLSTMYSLSLLNYCVPPEKRKILEQEI